MRQLAIIFALDASKASCHYDKASCHYMEDRVAKTDEKYIVRLPAGWRDAIKYRAAVNRRSMNQEILAALEGVVRLAAVGQGSQSSPAAAK